MDGAWLGVASWNFLGSKRMWAAARIFSASSTPRSPTEKALPGLANTSTAPNSRACMAILPPRGVKELTMITGIG